ncbi:MAG: VWA domain-containing protein [Leptospiraceae bacterium]|nr:VWA domain-containing protein [Leptospiraceae bacterium]MCP5502059.1 VWA domain-containing protein [Leptospiraceae bacterium]
MIKFDTIYWLFLSPALLLYVYYRFRFKKNDAVPYAPLQYKKPARIRFPLRHVKLFIEALVLFAVFLALTEPHKLLERNMVIDRGLDIVMALDVSASMQAADFPPNRLEFLKKISSSFIERNNTSRIGVFIFARDVFSQTPLTTDHSILQDLIKGIGFAVIDHNESGGTAIGDAILAASDSLIKNKKEGRDQVLIIITDGENSHGVDPLLAAHYAKSKNIRLYVVGVAGEEPVPVYVDGSPYLTPSGETLITSLDDTQLKTIAREAGGKFYRAKNSKVLEQIFDELSRMERTPIEIKKLSDKISYVPHISIGIFLLFSIWLILDGFFIRRPMR